MGKNLVLILAFCFGIWGSALAEEVLVLSSRAPGDVWQTEVQKSLNRGLWQKGWRVHWEFFSAKQLNQPEQAKLVLRLLTQEYGQHRPDYFIATDPTAFGWFVGTANKWRGKTPLLIGFNQSFSPLRLIGLQHVSGVVIQPRLFQVIQSALKLHPQGTDIFLINQPIGPGREIRRQFARLASLFPEKTFNVIEQTDRNNLLIEAQKWPAKSLVLLGYSPWINQGKPTPRSFESHLIIPLFETQLRQGAIGGPVLQVQSLVNPLLKLITQINQDPTVFPAARWLPSNRQVYQKDLLDQFHIPLNQLTKPYLLRGEKPLVYEGWLLTFSLVGCFVLGVAAFYLGYYFLKKSRAERTLKAANLNLTSQISTNTEQLDLIYQQVYHELSQRKGAEKALFASEQRFKAFVDHTPVGILVSNPRGKIEYVNKALSEVIEIDPEMILQKKVTDFFPEDLVIFSVSLPDSIEEHTHEWPLIKDNGEALVLLSQTAVYQSGEQGSKAITFVLDITALKQTETKLRSANREAQSAVKAKAAFLATMSHEIRTPLNCVIGMSSLLKDSPLNKEQHEYVDLVIHAGENLLSILNGVLDYSKIEAGQMKVSLAPTHLLTLVDKVVQLLVVQSEPKNLALDYHVSTSLPASVQIDEVRLSQMLFNLVGNAIKFTAQGQVDIQVKLKEKEQRILFEIRDTGIGITAEDQKKLFAPFQQLDGSPSRQFGGTGLGLAISRNLAQLMGGEISVDSDGNKGSVFRFDLPLVLVGGPLKPYESGMIAEFSEKRVLWISDNLPRTTAIIDWLHNWGVQVTAATSTYWNPGLLSHSWDLVMVDQPLEWLDTNLLWSEIQEQCKAPRLKVTPALSKLDPMGLKGPINPMHLYERLRRLWTPVVISPPHKAPPTYPELARTYPISILVADDNALNLKLTLKMLHRMGYEAEPAINGEEAVEKVCKRHFQLVLMDIQMPKVDGITAVTQIWDRLGAKRPKCIALTANTSPDDLLHYQSVGFDDTLTKPLMPRTFVNHIRMWGQFFAKEKQSHDLA